MELQIIGKNLEVPEAVQQYIQKKIGKLSRYLSNIAECKVEIYQEKTKSPQQRFRVQVTVNSKGTLIRGENRGEDVYVAIDSVAEVLARQIERYKGKLYDKGRGMSLARQEIDSDELVSEVVPKKVVKVKRFMVKPMSVDEAVEQMELLGHDFFLFVGADSGEVSLLYRRRDGNYGLIEPQLA